jgi:hypothetical protein
MKRIIGLLSVLVCLCWQLSTYGQTTVEITGIIKSQQGALQGAEVTFLTVNDEFQGNCISGPDGKFKSQYKVQIGKTIKIKITANEYSTFEKTFTVERSGNAGEFMLKRKTLNLSGFVRDSVTEAPLEAAEVFFYDESKLIQSKSTNNLGYFDLETNFTSGQKITIRVSKKNYYPKEQTLTFASEGRNTLPDILLPQVGDRGLRAYISVTDKKKKKPLSGVSVRYLDIKTSSHKDTIVASNGKVELKLYQQPGTTLELELSKPNYKTLKVYERLSADPLGNSFTYQMEKDRRSALGPVLLIGGSTAAVVSVAAYSSSNSKYNSYKDFGNPNREDDYDAAQSSRTISLVSGAVAVGCFTGYIIYKINQRKKEREAELKSKHIGLNRFSLFSPAYASGNVQGIGLAYRF